MTPQDRSATDDAALAATICAVAMIAHQVGGKATRDAFFLSSFSVTSLPVMLIVAAATSIVAVLATSAVLVRQGPFRFVPRAFSASAVLLLVVWLGGDRFPRATAVLVYLHIAAFGSILISGFWSAVNERFDPRTARQRISRIAAGGTAGGLAGGLLAERVGAWLDVTSMLPILASLHLVCAFMVRRMGVGEHRGPTPRDPAAPIPTRDGLHLLGTVRYLRDLGGLVLLGAVGAAFLDYLFKANATAAIDQRETLMRFFALFYTAASLLTLVVQSTVTRSLLAFPRTGLVRTVTTLPLAIALGGLVTLVPGLVAGSLGRLLESVMSNSTFRSAYELFYTPLSPRDKRASKSIIDVGFQRLGDAVGGAVVRGVLWALPGAALTVLSVAAGVTGLLGVLVARRLHRGYRKALESSLLSKAVDLDFRDIADGTTRTMVMETLSAVDLDSIRAQSGAMTREAPSSPLGSGSGPAPSGASTLDLQLEPLLVRIVELRSGDPQRVRRALALVHAPDAALVPHIVQLLAWDELSPHAVELLRKGADRHAGQLLDSLLDPDEEFAIRRRLPRVLAAGSNQRVVDGLLRGLRDKRFEVRYQCGRALARLRRHHPSLRFDRSEVLDAVLREATVDRRVWESHRLLDQIDDTDESPFVEEFLRNRSSRSLEHVFTVLSLVLPRSPLLTAYKGLLTTDPQLRGTALEYLESVLPSQVRQKLWPFLDDARPADRPALEREEILEQLMRSNASIELNLEELRRQQTPREREEP